MLIMNELEMIYYVMEMTKLTFFSPLIELLNELLIPVSWSKVLQVSFLARKLQSAEEQYFTYDSSDRS